ncbi:tetratricopeptide repeat protein [Streptohalobacillus salinus]|uniref:Tetratricopeptide repeat protein n=1 Tax=Streptohalobacillus salinus TaxID=621096 RepID=A0A2V3WEL0_9BACI|nr:tetratricopeptide repeat protein [Streptohalobacillus salinus]PXW91584.1 tetratricopeptide repeat protein [Streptohalobacillus salinus]
MTFIEQGIAHMKKDELEEAATAFNQAIETEPNNPAGYINFGNLLVHMKDYQRAERFFMRALVKDSNAATAYYGLGNLYFESEQYKRAIEHYQQARTLGLDEADVHFMIGLSHLNRHDSTRALPFMMRAKELAPTDQDILMQYGILLAETGEYKEALQQFQAVLNTDHFHSDARYNLALAYLYLEETDQAIKELDQTIAIDPEHVLAKQTKAQINQILDQN